MNGCYPNYPCPGQHYGLINDTKEYIQDELSDSLYYTELAKKAPTPRAKTILEEFSKDEKNHAQHFIQAYYLLTGMIYQPTPVKPPVIPEYEEALKQRIIAETNDYKKYGEKYLMVNIPALKDLFFMTRTDEAIHAMRIPILFEEED